MSIPSTQKAVQILEQGGLDVLQVRSGVPVPKINDNQVLIKTEWAGVNFIDTYQRGGVYPVKLPFILGNEPSGRVVQLGKNVDPSAFGFNVGDAVAAYGAGTGYSEYSVTEASKTIKLPEGVSTKEAAALVLQGLTALTALREAHSVQKGEWVLIHAASGGLGLLLTQIAKASGAYVIGTTSTPEKAELAKAHGADHVVLYKDVPFSKVAEQILKLTPDGQGVHAVIDGVGKDTFDLDFDVLRRKGTLVSIGNASGTVPPVAPLRLAAKNLKLVRPTLGNYVYTKEEWQTYSTELFHLVASGKVKITLSKEEGYPFTTEGVRQAHQDISSRSTTGKLLIKISSD